MKKSINVDSTFSGMRIDRFLRRYFDSIPQSLIERNLRNGKIKLNSRKTKSSTKVKNNDLIELFNFDLKKSVIVKKEKFKPSNTIIKENEDFISTDENFTEPLVFQAEPSFQYTSPKLSKKTIERIFKHIGKTVSVRIIIARF